MNYALCIVLWVVQVLVVEVEDVVGGLQQLRGFAIRIYSLRREIIVDSLAAPSQRPVQASPLYKGSLVVRMREQAGAQCLKPILGSSFISIFSRHIYSVEYTSP